MGFSIINQKGVKFFLHNKAVKLKNGLERTIYFFSKAEAGAVPVPVGYEPVVSKTGLPVLRKAD